MLEPLSIVAVVGFGIGSIGFLASGIENVYQRFHEISEHKERLLQRRQELYVASLGLQNWNNQWFGSHRAETSGDLTASGQHYWGEDRYAEIEDRLKFIQQLSERIWRTLSLDERAEQRLSGDYRMRSSTHFSRLCEDISCFASSRVLPSLGRENDYTHFLRRLVLAVAGSGELTRNIERLKRLVQDLMYVSEEAYKARQIDRHRPLPSFEELIQLNEAKVFIDSLIVFVNELYLEAAARLSSETWALELRYPDDMGDLTELHAKAFVDIDLVVFGLSEEPRTWRRRRIRYTRGQQAPHAPRDIVLSIARDLESSCADLPCVERLPPPDDKRFGSLRDGLCNERRQGFNPYELSELALNLSNWAFLLWGSEWPLELCSCRISGLLTSGELCYMLAPSCRGVTGSQYGGHHHRATGKLLLLGTVLAELGLLQPLVAKPAARYEDPGIMVRFRDVELWSVMSQRVLGMSEVFHSVAKARGRKYRKSMQFCFDFDDKTRNRKELLAEDLVTFQERVVEP